MSLINYCFIKIAKKSLNFFVLFQEFISPIYFFLYFLNSFHESEIIKNYKKFIKKSHLIKKNELDREGGKNVRIAEASRGNMERY